MKARQREEEERRVKVGENVGAVIYLRDRTDRACIPWFEKVEWRGAREPVRHLRTLAALLENTAPFSASIYASSSRDPMSSSGLHRHQPHMWHTDRHTGKTLRHIK